MDDGESKLDGGRVDEEKRGERRCKFLSFPSFVAHNSLPA